MEWVEIDESREVLRRARTVAVLGIKPESRREQPAFWIPEYLASVGYAIVPVPVHYPEVQTILGQRVVRRLADLPKSPDIVSVFRRPSDVAGHLEDLLTARPAVIWFQSVCLDLATAKALSRAGLRVACSCIGCTRATIQPTQDPLPAQLQI